MRSSRITLLHKRLRNVDCHVDGSLKSDCKHGCTVSFHYGADHYGACQYDDSTMAQVQLGASRYGAFQHGAGPVWRCFSLAHSSMAQVQYGAFHYGAVPGWRFEASS